MSKSDSKSRASRRRCSRRRLLRVLATAGAVMVADGLWWEPHRLTVERLELAFSELPPGLEGLRIVQFSDLHRGPVVRQEEIGRAVARANALAPDLALLTGGYVSLSRHYAEPCGPALSALRPPLARPAPLGTH